MLSYVTIWFRFTFPSFWVLLIPSESGSPVRQYVADPASLPHETKQMNCVQDGAGIVNKKTRKKIPSFIKPKIAPSSPCFHLTNPTLGCVAHALGVSRIFLLTTQPQICFPFLPEICQHVLPTGGNRFLGARRWFKGDVIGLTFCTRKKNTNLNKMFWSTRSQANDLIGWLNQRP
jgi:hypothetical protein